MEMKEVKVDVRSCALGFAAGLVCGGAAMYLATRRDFSAKLDREVLSVKEYYRDQAEKFVEAELASAGPADLPDLASYGGNKDVRTSTVADDANAGSFVVAVDPTEGLDEEDGDEEPDEEVEASAPPVSAASTLRDTKGPYEISAEEFAESPVGTQAISITYFAGDSVLVDDKNDPIPDVKGTVGKLNPLLFGGISGDPHIRYVRNEKLEVDFEIVLDQRSYVDVVLNYGNPNRKTL